MPPNCVSSMSGRWSTRKRWSWSDHSGSERITARRCDNRIKRGFRRVSALKAGAIHPAAWLCSPGKFTGRKRDGLPGALLRVLPGRHPIRAEPAWSGAGKRCYGK
ncbi:hypothetical protein IYN89_23800 (plasmid) [Salmonella enterica subsp. enterica]|uniref:hypothetical protein n=1 Tax=Salmonella enterica TaxID=28901 RepID=UPI0027E5B38A|nr:hypothetical protein [Salmonella enterica]WMP46587.1 hypothetical protein IYN89_23800 [Salmonella enterica subsp. enterica]